jgi:6,7-dimethyl-8-ribityllumazine synthase
MYAPIAIVVSQFNKHITDKLLEGAETYLHEQGYDNQSLSIIRVPGAVEIPFTAQQLAKTKQFHAIIALGAVVRGETSHYDYVCEQVSQGCQRVMLDHDLPVIFGVLTTDNDEQALQRVGGKEGHKGREAAEAAIMMIAITENIREKTR